MRPGDAVGRGEVVAGGDGVQVVGPEPQLLLLEGRLVHLDGVVDAPGGGVVLGEAVTGDECVRLVGPKRRLLKLEGRLVHPDGVVDAPGGQEGLGEVVAVSQRVGMVIVSLQSEQRRGALKLRDRQRGLAQVVVGHPQHVADLRLDERLILKHPGDLRLGGVHRLAYRHLHAQAAPPVPRVAAVQHVDLEEGQYGLGSLGAALVRLC